MKFWRLVCDVCGHGWTVYRGKGSRAPRVVFCPHCCTEHPKLERPSFQLYIDGREIARATRRAA